MSGLVTRIAWKSCLIGSIVGMLCAANLPNPAIDQNRSDQKSETAVFAGGCFWGVEAVFDSVKGVADAVAGYSGGSKANAHYEIVSNGTTGHAESVQITFDPSQVSFGQLLKIYFSVHDPTTLNRQDPDEGTQYRSEIFYTTEEQKRVADPAIERGEGLRETHRDEGVSSSGFLSRRRLPSGLRTSLPAESAGVYE